MPDLSIDNLILVFGGTNCSVASVSSIPFDVFEIKPQEYLEFARLDLNEDSLRGHINALSNAKRALSCRIDEVIAISNLKYFSDKYRWSLPYKLQVLNTLDVKAPQVLKTYISDRRNVVEHEYVKPASDEIRILLDIVELFIAASQPYIDDGYTDSIRINIPIGKATENKDEKRKVTTQLYERYYLEFDYTDAALQITLNEVEEISIWNYHNFELTSRDKLLNEYQYLDIFASHSEKLVRDFMSVIRRFKSTSQLSFS